MNIIENGIPIIIVIIVFIFVLYRQIHPRKVSGKGLIIIPAIILFFLVKSLTTFHPTSAKLLEISITSIVTILLGFFANRQLDVYKGPTGKAMARGSWTYFLWWLAAFVIKSVLSILFKETSYTTLSETEILLPIFFLMATRNSYLYWKINKLGLELH